MTLAIQYTGDDSDPKPALGLAPAPTDVEPPNRHPSMLTAFEKAPVSRTEIKISGQCAVNTFDEVEVSLDDRLRVVGEFRVVKVLHYVDKAGEVVRQQVIAPISDLELVPWDPADPTDDGIVRVRP